jgi:hypothetical protein
VGIVHYHQHWQLEALVANNRSTDLFEFDSSTWQPENSATKLLNEKLDKLGLAHSGSAKNQSVAIETSKRVFYPQSISIQTNAGCQINLRRSDLSAIDFGNRIF